MPHAKIETQWETVQTLVDGIKALNCPVRKIIITFALDPDWEKNKTNDLIFAELKDDRRFSLFERGGNGPMWLTNEEWPKYLVKLVRNANGKISLYNRSNAYLRIYAIVDESTLRMFYRTIELYDEAKASFTKDELHQITEAYDNLHPEKKENTPNVLG
jgi:hypothetical protein